MEISHTDTLERIARVLAGLKLSRNGAGEAKSAAAEVDRTWRDHMADATAVLNALREPDARMAAAGDLEVWTRMVCAGLGENVKAPPGEWRSFAGEHEIYQKPLG